MTDEIQKSNSKTHMRKSLWPFYYDVERYQYSNQERARALFDQILAEGLDNYTASPDLWHNAAMVAGRVQHRIA